MALAVDARRPAGGAGAGGDDQAGGGLALGAVADVEGVAGGLVGGVADEHLVEGEQGLAVVEVGGGHRAVLERGAAGGDVGEQVGGGVRARAGRARRASG